MNIENTQYKVKQTWGMLNEWEAFKFSQSIESTFKAGEIKLLYYVESSNL